MIESAGGLVGCTINTSAPRTFSSMRTKISPSANREIVMRVRSTPKHREISSASPLFAVPASSLNPRRGTLSSSMSVAL